MSLSSCKMLANGAGTIDRMPDTLLAGLVEIHFLVWAQVSSLTQGLSFDSRASLIQVWNSI